MKINNAEVNLILNTDLTCTSQTSKDNNGLIFSSYKSNVTQEGKDLAKELETQILGPSWYQNTINLLKKIKPDNVVETCEYYKTNTKNTLAQDIDKEWGLGIDEIKIYICSRIKTRADELGIKLNNYTKLDTIEKVNDFIEKAIKKIKKAETSIINMKQSFTKETIKKMRSNPRVTTILLKTAQQNLGLREVTLAEYNKLSDAEKSQTQMKVIGTHGTVDHAWCAHTVSYLCRCAGVDIGEHKKAVQQFIAWGISKKTYKPISTNKMTDKNFTQERQARAEQIKTQLSNMHEGDFIIWKSQFAVKVKGANNSSELKTNKASHIGIIESVNVKQGTVTVLEGNANISKVPRDGNERVIVSNEKEGVTGNQEVGEYQELNRRDGLIRKTYTINELAKFGYSGYIDNQKIMH